MEIKDLAGISEPLKRLVEVISEGVGEFWRPYLTKKNAEAKAYEIEVIAKALANSRRLIGNVSYEDGSIKSLTSSEALSECLSLPERLEARSTYQELRKQQNIEAVCANAAEELKDESDVSEYKPEPEWINHFFDIAEKISTEDLQYWWGKILAGEIKNPGSFSLRTLEVLKNISRQEAENFVKLAQFILSTPNMAFFIAQDEFLADNSNALSFSDILVLREAGLVSNNDFLAFPLGPFKAGDSFKLRYGPLILILESDDNISAFDSSVGSLTKAGMELLKLIQIQPNEEYMKIVSKKIYRKGMKISWAPIAQVTDDSLYLVSLESRVYFNPDSETVLKNLYYG